MASQSRRHLVYYGQLRSSVTASLHEVPDVIRIIIICKKPDVLLVTLTLHRHDNGLQDINAGFSTMTFTSKLSGSSGNTRNPDLTLSPVSSSPDSGTFMNLLQQADNPFCPPSPISPVFRQQSNPQFARQNTYGASPVVDNKQTFSPVGTTPASYDGRSSQFQLGDNKGSLPPPPNLDNSFDGLNCIGRIDNNAGLFSSGNLEAPQSPFVSTPIMHGNAFSGGIMNRDRSFSSPTSRTRQLPIGAKSPQVLHEDKPSSWNEGSGFPAPYVYRTDAILSPTKGGGFSSRPPRYGGNQGAISPRAEPNQLSSDGGNFNVPSHMPPFSHSSVNNHMRSQSLGMMGGASNFENSLQGQGVQFNGFGGGGMDNL